MSDRSGQSSAPAYETFSDDYLLALAACPEDLTETARQELSVELERRHIGEDEVAAHRAEAARIRARQARWRKVQRLRLKEGIIFGFLWPLGTVLVFVALIVGAGFLRNPPWLRQGPLEYVTVAQICVLVLFVLAGVYIFYSGRADPWLHWWRRGSCRVPSDRSARRKWFHAEYCAARHWGAAALFLVTSLWMMFLAHRDMTKPWPGHREAAFTLISLGLVVAVAVKFSVMLSCLRERLVLGVWAVDFFILLVNGVAPALLAPYGHAVREFQQILWVGAVLVSLTLFRSAIHAPPPGESRAER